MKRLRIRALDFCPAAKGLQAATVNMPVSHSLCEIYMWSSGTSNFTQFHPYSPEAASPGFIFNLSSLWPTEGRRRGASS